MYRVAIVLVLAALVGIGMATQLRSQEAPPPPPSDEEVAEAHLESLLDPAPEIAHEQFLKEFIASGQDVASLPRSTYSGLGYPVSQSLTALLDQSLAVVRGNVKSVSFSGRAGSLDGFPQFFCYASFSVRVDESLRGDVAPLITVVQDGCPQQGADGATVEQFSLYIADPSLAPEGVLDTSHGLNDK